MSATTYTACPECNQVNRVNLESGRQPICGKCSRELSMHGAVSEIGGSGLKALIEKSPLPVVADFWAPWCGPCQMFAPSFERAASQLSDQFVFVKLNTEAFPLASDTWGVRGIPTLILFQNGLELRRQSGAMHLETFIHWLNDARSAA